MAVDLLNETESGPDAEGAARRLVECLKEGHHTLALVESCTAGLVADLIARVSGASAVLWGSFVCYSPEAKRQMLGIEGALLKQYGLVSRETVREMALRALDRSDASIAAAVTGLAGPLGDGSVTPVGTVWVAVAERSQRYSREKELHFQGTRAEIRVQAAVAVIKELLQVCLT